MTGVSPMPLPPPLLQLPPQKPRTPGVAEEVPGKKGGSWLRDLTWKYMIVALNSSKLRQNPRASGLANLCALYYKKKSFTQAGGSIWEGHKTTIESKHEHHICTCTPSCLCVNIVRGCYRDTHWKQSQMWMCYQALDGRAERYKSFLAKWAHFV